ncbi:MAG: tRNA lysidine(34) synthetase TilS [Planctomycetota bacterium]
MFDEDLYRELTTLNVAGEGILLAVSGGADSIAMLHAMSRIAYRLPLERIEVAHFNHGLRVPESDVDAEFVRRTSSDLELICHTHSVSPGALACDSRGSLEETARKARYQFLTDVAHQRGLSHVATAHHLQDQRETILHNLLRGTGLRGLRGIPSVREISTEVRLIRPMLNIERTAIRKWLSDERLEFREDSSNEEMEFTRNRLRRVLGTLPESELAELGSSLTLLSQQAGTTIACLDTAAAQVLKKAILEATDSVIQLSRTRLLEFPEPLVRHSIYILWASSKWPLQHMTRQHWIRLSHAISLGTPHRSMFPAAIELRIRRDLIVLTRG